MTPQNWFEKRIPEVEGWRVSYLYAGELRSPRLGQIIRSQELAQCRSHGHSAPALGCKCGYYAVTPGPRSFYIISEFLDQLPRLPPDAEQAMGRWFSENQRNDAARVFHQVTLFGAYRYSPPIFHTDDRITVFRAKSLQIGPTAITNTHVDAHRLAQWFANVQIVENLSSTAESILETGRQD